MRRFSCFLGALALLGSTAAMAADMPVKAPLISPFINYGSGWYWGVGTYAGVAQSSVSGNQLLATGLVSGNLEAAGGGVDVAIGYMKGSTANLGFGNWYRFEAEAAYQNIQGGVSVPGDSASVKSHWALTQEFDIGADVLAAIMARVGNIGLTIPAFQPALPANVAVAAMPKQYFGVVLREFQMSGDFGKANGQTWGIAPGIKSGFIYRTVDSNGNPNGGGIDLWASVSWAAKGKTFSNVFAANGAPITIGPGANMGTTYLAGIRADFGL